MSNLNGWRAEISRQVPGLVVMLILVMAFLRAWSAHEVVMITIADRCHMHAIVLTERYGETAKQAADGLRENTHMLGNVAEILRTMRMNHTHGSD